MTSGSIQVARRCYRFGPFAADARKRLLQRGRQIVGLTPKAFEILIVLIEHRGRAVGKDELVAAVWGDAIVEDATLARHISTLRRALDDRPTEHLYIVTIPGFGYEFVAEVVEIDKPRAPEQVPEQLETGRVRFDAAVLESRVPRPGPVPIAPTAVRPRKFVRRVLWAGMAIVAAACVASVLAFRADWQAMPRGQTQRTLRQFTFHGGLQREPAWSPNGEQVAFTSDAAGNSDIWIQAVNDPYPVRVTTSPAEDSQPDWSPDGRSLVFRSERDKGGLYVVSSDGSSERLLATFGYRPKWSPNGRFVLFTSSGHQGGPSRIYVVDATGGEPRLLRPDLIGSVGLSDAAWRPDGRAVSILGRIGSEPSFITVPLEEGPPLISKRLPVVEQQIADARVTLERFTWSRSGRHLFFEGTSERVRNVWRVTVNPRSLEWIAGPERLTTGAGQDAEIALSPDGTRMVFSTRSSRTRLWTFPFDAQGGRLTGEGYPVTSGGANEQDADALVDGSKLVYSAVRGNRQELWEVTVSDGRERLLLSTTEFRRTRPRWSRDGLRLAYMRSRSGPPGERVDAAVAVLRAGGEERLLTRPGEVSLIPSDWSPDGRWLLGGCRLGSPVRIGSCAIPVSDVQQSASSMKVLASDPGKDIFESRFSPNQRWVSFLAVEMRDARVSTIYVVPAHGGAWVPITEGGWYDDKPHWSQDGRTLYFISNRQGPFNVWGRHFDPTTGTPRGEPFQVTSFMSPRRTMAADLPRTQIAVTNTHLFLPITEAAGELWVLDHVDR